MSSSGMADAVALTSSREAEEREVTSATHEDVQETDSQDDETHGLKEQAFGMVRRYFGEQVAEQLLRTKDELSEQMKKKVKETKKGVKNKISKARDDVSEQIQENIHLGGRKIFEKLFPRSDQAKDDSFLNGVSPSESPFWKERTANWADCLEPQGRIWFAQALPTSLLTEDADLSYAFDESIPLDEEIEQQIKLDLPRTFPSIEEFDDSSLMDSLEHTLRATALTCPEVGYVQGMNFLVGYLILHCKTEALAHRLCLELLTNPKYNLRGVFEDGLPTLRRLANALKVVLKEKDEDLYNHLQELGFEEYFFSFQWISTLFAYYMPFDALQHVWDIFFETSWEGFFSVCLVLIEDRRSVLLSQDFDDVCGTLKECITNPREDFYTRAKNVRFSESTKAFISSSFSS